MTILKSGVEMTPDELIELKGGACACGCSDSHNSSGISFVGVRGNDCDCGCEWCVPAHTSADDHAGNWADAWEAIQ